jgi:hypothetical protein
MVSHSKNINFWRAQALKAKSLHLNAKAIFARMNSFNGEEHQISFEVKLLFLPTIIFNFRNKIKIYFLKNLRKILTRGIAITKEHGQRRHIKMTKIISNYINFETRRNGFSTAKSLHYKILDIFQESISLNRIRKERKNLGQY